jgi:molybdopterin converting factor small subunit
VATLIPHASLAALLGARTLQSEAASIRELLSEIEARLPPEEWRRASRASILVNGISIHRMSGLDTPLGPGDQVWMVLPAGGG